MSAAVSIDLPPWAVVTDKRRAHITRVASLLAEWAEAMDLDDAERDAWIDAGRLHDALRDASEPDLRAITGETELPAGILHGPACASRLTRDGERRTDLLEAIRWHTTGCARWSRVGRALFMADFLEPGRSFAQGDRAFLASHVPDDFDRVFRQVVRMRLEWSIREGKGLFPETVELWNHVR